MAAFNQFDVFSEDLANGVHQMSAAGHTLKVYLSNDTPASAHAVKADLAEIAAGNGYTAGGFDTQNDTSRAGAVTSVAAIDIVITANGGPIGPYQHAVLYNASSPSDSLIGWWSRTAPITLADGEFDTLDFGTSVLTVQ